MGADPVDSGCGGLTVATGAVPAQVVAASVECCREQLRDGAAANIYYRDASCTGDLDNQCTTHLWVERVGPCRQEPCRRAVGDDFLHS